MAPDAPAAAANLDELVTSVATSLMGVDSASLQDVAGTVLRTLVEYFGVDLGFLRFHDLERRTTVLVAEWPPRAHVPDPDPLGVISFETADPAFAASEHLTDIYVLRPDPASEAYQQRVREGSGEPATSVATVPLRSADVTTGTVGFIKFGDRGWSEDEVRALRTIATLLAQVQARMSAEEQLRHLAHHDELTGLPNRRALMGHLQETLAGEGVLERALMFVDVDRLKAMNDLLGHAAGDAVITAVADRLRATVGPADFVARLGGDEFVVCLAGPSDDVAALAVAHRIQDAMVEPVLIGGQLLSRTVSVGIAVARPTPADVSAWLRDADQAVLAAKSRGGNVRVAFTETMRAHDDVRAAVELQLPGAIRDRSLVLHYQTVVDLRTRCVVGVEALLRWDHPTLGPVDPELFVGVAEATNLAVEMGRWVLDESCRQLAAWRAARPGPATRDLVVSVNISPVQLIGVDFVDTVAATLAAHGLVGADVMLEVTERGVVTDESAALRTLHGLHALGVAIAIDDFGTGYSSLAQLKALPVDVLKLDKGFVRDLASNPDDLAIVRSIVGLAESFGLDLIAEGVESEASARVLLELGCPRAQGYLFSRGVPPGRLLAALDDPARCPPGRG